MALIKCPECSSSVSDKAKDCPKCGYPIFGKIVENDPKNAEGIQRSDEIAEKFSATMAAHKSYTGASVLVFFMYCLLYIPGLILNVIYLRDAKRIEKMTGVKPQGTGCLTALIWLLFWIPLIFFLIFLIFGLVPSVMSFI